MSERTVFVVSLQALPDVDGVLALRAALKRLLRDHRLRCVAVVE